MMPIGLYLLLGFGLFTIGALGAVSRRNPLTVLMSIVFILTAAGINLAAFARMFGDASGQAFAFFVFLVALVQVGVGVAILRISGLRVPANRQNEPPVPAQDSQPLSPNS